MNSQTPLSSLDPSPEQILDMGRASIEFMARYFSQLREQPVYPHTTSPQVLHALDSQFPSEGQDFKSLLDQMEHVVFPLSRHNSHPRFFGYIASPGNAPTALADMLASALNPSVTSWRSAPGPAQLERQTIDWIKQILGYPASAEGLFVSGGSLANFCGLAVARDAKSSTPITNTGCQALERPLRIYTSQEGHFSINKAAGLLGIGRDNVVSVNVNQNFQIDIDDLVAKIQTDQARGLQPCCIVATAGTTVTGACDPLNEVADIAARFGLWFHVDACYGGFATLAPGRTRLFAGIDRADSIALDPHKWLYIPSDCGCVLYRNPKKARATFAHDAEYTRILAGQADEAYAFWDYGPELTRRFRALKVWLMLKHVGTEALGQAIEDNCRCADYLAQLVTGAEDFELLAPVQLSVVCLRYLPPGLKHKYISAGPEEQRALDQQLNTLNERTLTQVQRSGSSYPSNANIHGRFALRACVLNYRTTMRDMEFLLDDIRHAAQQVSTSQ